MAERHNGGPTRRTAGTPTRSASGQRHTDNGGTDRWPLELVLDWAGYQIANARAALAYRLEQDWKEDRW